MMSFSTFLNWLSNRKSINLIILVVYFCIAVLPHEQVGLLTVAIFGALSRDNYNLIILGMVLLGMVIYLLPVFHQAKKHNEVSWIGSFLLFNILMAAICFNYLFVINIEAIHFLQYAIFAILCFPLTRNYTQTIGITAIAGAIDEAYQYMYLAPERTEYYDLNDVVINTVGGAFGLILIRAFRAKNIQLKFFKSPFFILLALFVLSVILMMVTGQLSYLREEGIPFSFIKNLKPTFWTTVHPNVTYHVMRPLEGFIITGILIFIYGQMGRQKPTNL